MLTSINPQWQPNQSVNPANYSLPSLTNPVPGQLPANQSVMPPQNQTPMAPVQTAANVAGTANAASQLGSLWGGGNIGPVASGAEYAAALPGQGLMGGVGLGGIAAGGYTGVKQFEGVKNFAQGKPMDPMSKAALFLPTFGLSAIPGVGKLIGGHSQRYYDGEKREKFLNNAFQGNPQATTLKNGKTYNFSEERDAENNYQMDINSPTAQATIQYLRPLALTLSDGDAKLTDDIIRVMHNELTDKGKLADPKEIRAQALRAYEYFNLKPSQIKAKLEELKGRTENGISEEDFNIHNAGLSNLLPGGGPIQLPSAPVVPQGQQSTAPQQTPIPIPGLNSLMKGDKMANGKTYMGPGVYR